MEERFESILKNNETKIGVFGSRYMVPAWKKKETMLAINVGGAVIPILLSL